MTQVIDWNEVERLDQQKAAEQMAALAKEVAALKRENELLREMREENQRLREALELARDMRDALATTLQNKRRGEKRGALPRLSPRPLNRPVTIANVDGARITVYLDFKERTYKRCEVSAKNWALLTAFLIRDGLFDCHEYCVTVGSLATGEPDEFYVEELTFPRKEAEA